MPADRVSASIAKLDVAALDIGELVAGIPCKHPKNDCCLVAKFLKFIIEPPPLRIAAVAMQRP